MEETPGIDHQGARLVPHEKAAQRSWVSQGHMEMASEEGRAQGAPRTGFGARCAGSVSRGLGPGRSPHGLAGAGWVSSPECADMSPPGPRPPARPPPIGARVSLAPWRARVGSSLTVPSSPCGPAHGLRLLKGGLTPRTCHGTGLGGGRRGDFCLSQHRGPGLTTGRGGQRLGARPSPPASAEASVPAARPERVPARGGQQPGCSGTGAL